MDKIENQTLALAGMFQSATLIEKMAVSGELNQQAFDCGLDSLFKFDASSTLDVYGEVKNLNFGLESLIIYLGGEGKSRGNNVAYYLMSMLKISSKLSANTKLGDKLQQSLLEIKTTAADFELGRSNIIAKVDALYQDSISKMSPRVIIRGDQSHLQNNDNASKIRALLLAGIRSAVLWHQLGGNKWKLLFSRKKFVASAKQFLQQE